MTAVLSYRPSHRSVCTHTLHYVVINIVFHATQLEQVPTLNYIRELGGGFNGKVCLVEANGLHCITKRPQDTSSSSTSAGHTLKVHTNFLRELLVLPQLRHPNVIQFLGVNFDQNEPGHLALVIEYLPFDLDELLRACQGKFPLPLQLSILLDISLGIHYIHSRGIVHCDLTPDNILLSSALCAKICDFGCSKSLGSRDITGYPQNMRPYFRTYMPPEVFEPNFLYTEEFDVFTFGVLAMYVATQMLPVRSMGREVSVEARERGEEELERHREVFSILEQEGHCLTSLIRECVQDEKEKRISPQDIIACLRSWLKIYPKQLQHIVELNAFITYRLSEV